MRRESIVVVAILLAFLLPMWYVGLQGEPPAEEIEIDHSVSEIRPLDGFLDTPEKLSPSQVGVIVWVALFGMVGVLTGAHRFMNDAVRPPDDEDARPEHATVGLPWFHASNRWVVEYHSPSDARRGILVMGSLTVLAITFAALFTGEYFTLARTQYFGVYAAGMFFSLAGLTVAYYAWFMPHVAVAERRGHR